MLRHIALIVLAGVLVYGSSLSGPWMFDDESSIVQNAQIRRLSPMSVPLNPPRDTPVAGRPLVNLTFALNYAVGGLDVTGYHVVNLGLHLLSALVLYGVIRRGVRLPRVPTALRDEADGVALAAALLWVVHPLNTETVSYLTQRTEGLMALCYLLTVYAAIRGLPLRGGAWTLAAVAAAAAGMASKESMVTAPVMVALLDRALVFPSWRAAWERRAPLYGGLAASWLVLAFLLWQGPRSTVGFSAGVSAWTYVLNQLEVVPRYLSLVVWPDALVLDYGLPRAIGVVDVWLPGAFLLVLAALTVVALWRQPPLGVLGVWVFVTLAPTSSVVPIATEVGAERRMYLPMAALMLLAVLALRWAFVRGDAGVRRMRWRVVWAAVALACVALGVRTVWRLRDYQSRLTMAQSIVDRRPHGRARFLLASELVEAQQSERALAQLRLAVNDYPQAHFALATEMLASGRAADAVTEARAFVRLNPSSPALNTARDLLGQALAIQGQLDEAAEQFGLLTRATPMDPGPFVRLGDIRLRQRRFSESIAHFQSALALRPTDADIFRRLGLALSAEGRYADAVDAFGRGVELRPNDISLLNFLGRALAAEGRFAEAVFPMRRLVELAPSDTQGRLNLAEMERRAALQPATPAKP